MDVDLARAGIVGTFRAQGPRAESENFERFALRVLALLETNEYKPAMTWLFDN